MGMMFIIFGVYNYYSFRILVLVIYLFDFIQIILELF